MAQSLAKIYVHLIFSTKRRERFQLDAIRSSLHAYVGGVLRDLDSPALEIMSEPEHMHILFLLSRTQTISDVVGQVKRGSCSWLKTKQPAYSHFHWQNGFGAFSVSQSAVDEVREYIRDQRGHNKRVTFQDEFRTFLRLYEVKFDERYVWD